MLSSESLAIQTAGEINDMIIFSLIQKWFCIKTPKVKRIAEYDSREVR